MNFLKLIVLMILLSSTNGCNNDMPKLTIYTIGDSTMADKKPDVYPETGWCQVLNNYLDKGITVRNHAVNGRSTKSFISEKKWQAVLDSLKKGDFVFIQFGHNDEKENDSTRYTTPFGTYKTNLERFVSDTRSKGATPVLFTPIVRRKFGSDGLLSNTHGDYPAAVREVAHNMNVLFIDLQKITEQWVNSLGSEPSKEYFLWTSPNEKYPEGRKDDTHLSEKGANEIACLALQECIKQNLPFSDRILKGSLKTTYR
jgi:lysophospholipase L1-like esterase